LIHINGRIIDIFCNALSFPGELQKLTPKVHFRRDTAAPGKLDAIERSSVAGDTDQRRVTRERGLCPLTRE